MTPEIELELMTADPIELEVASDQEDLNLEAQAYVKGSGDGSLTEEVKQALLQMAEHVAYIDEHGQDYYQDLYDALYPPRVLTYISVVYDPGTAVIYESTSLDSLKQYLVVTAHYDDRTTEIIASSDYTLSGTLEVGTSVITAEYRSKTKDFSVEVAETPTLSSITAVFTQGSAVIYTTDSLDTLKQYLVVTANYSDGSSETVTNYTLSGTLTAGTSTITVTYGNKTDIFSVTVHAGLPSEYTKYDYLKYTGNITKQESSDVWIALKKYDNLNALSLEFALKPQDNNPGAAILGRRSASGSASSFGFYSKRTTLGWHLHGTEANVEPSTILGAVNVVKYTNTSASPSSLQTNDNAPISVVWTNNNVLNLAPVMFSNPVNDTKANLSDDAEMGYLKFSNLNGEIVGHYIPAVRTADNRIGMFDLIEQVFYTSATASYTTIGNSSCKYAVGDWS